MPRGSENVPSQVIRVYAKLLQLHNILIWNEAALVLTSTSRSSLAATCDVCHDTKPRRPQQSSLHDVVDIARLGDSRGYTILLAVDTSPGQHYLFMVIAIAEQEYPGHVPGSSLYQVRRGRKVVGFEAASPPVICTSTQAAYPSESPNLATNSQQKVKSDFGAPSCQLSIQILNPALTLLEVMSAFHCFEVSGRSYNAGVTDS